MFNRRIRSSLVSSCLLVACGDDVGGGPGDESTSAGTTGGGDDGASSLTLTITDSQGDDGTSSAGTTGSAETGKAESTGESADTGAPSSTGAGSEGSSGADETSSTGSGSNGSGSTGSGSTGPGSTGSGGESVCNDDGVLDQDEVCDGDELGGATCLSEGFTGGSLSCSGCQLVTDACTEFSLPGVSEVFISELMPAPQTVDAASGGQWLELHNPSAATTYQLRGCEVLIEGGQGIDIETDLEIEPRSFVTLAAQSPSGPGFTPDATWNPLDSTLPADEGLLTLRCDDVDVDVVLYDGDFPLSAGASVNLDPPFFSAEGNDDGFNWCAATQSYNGDFGSPGSANELCTPEFEPTYCHLQFPTSILDGTPGASETVYGRVYMEGLTDQSSATDVSVNVVAQVGYGPDGSDPADNDAWTWLDAEPNEGWDGAGTESNNDEYQAELVLPPAGTYDFAYRFSGDFGSTFLHCDANSENDGYEPASAGDLVVQ